MRAKRYWVLTVCLLIFLIIPSAGCSLLAEKAPFGLSVAEVPREISPSVDADLLDQQVNANNDFAFDLYQSLRLEDGNLVYSPYSISTALAMVYAGARGETEAQMSQALHYVLPQEQLHPVFNLLDQTLTALGDSDDDFQLHIANSLWGQDEYPFLPDFLDLLARNYGAEIHLVDFTSSRDREAARQAINAWVSQQTNNRIKNLLAEGSLSEETRLVLVNAIYTKGKWSMPFENDGDYPFTLLDGQQVNVPTMLRRSNTDYYLGNGCQVVVLPYESYNQRSRAEMIIVMPDPGTFVEFEQSFDQFALDRILYWLQRDIVHLYIPGFEFDYKLDLSATLAGMGMKEAFDPFGADLSGMYDQSSVPFNLAISNVIHQAHVLVDDEGTEAWAATGIIVTEVIEGRGDMDEPLEIHIDHPFIFLIRDAATGSILFMGRVLDPRSP